MSLTDSEYVLCFINVISACVGAIHVVLVFKLQSRHSACVGALERNISWRGKCTTRNDLTTVLWLFLHCEELFTLLITTAHFENHIDEQLQWITWPLWDYPPLLARQQFCCWQFSMKSLSRMNVCQVHEDTAVVVDVVTQLWHVAVVCIDVDYTSHLTHW